MKKKYSKFASEFLQLKVKRIDYPCEKCLVKAACIIIDCYFIRGMYELVDTGEVTLDSHILASIIDATKNFNLGFNEIIEKSYSCDLINLFFTINMIKFLQKGLRNGRKISPKELSSILKRYKELCESTKN